jgi:CheY-like chemotaxis protein
MIIPPIICAEDEDAARWELQEALGQRYPVRAVGSASEAVETARRDGISLLLADIKMPNGGMDGIDAAREIRALYPRVPVVFVTAYRDDPHYRQRVLEARLAVSGWIAKPLIDDSRRELESVVKREMDLGLMRRMVDACDARGLTLGQTWAAVDALASAYGLSEEAFARLQEELGMDSLPNVITDLLRALDRVRTHYDDVENRQLSFHELKDVALTRLPSVCRYLDQDTRRMALLMRMAVRQMKGLELTPEQLDALEYALVKLRDNQVSEEDRSGFRWKLRQVGIQTTLSLGQKSADLLEIYDEYDESEESAS